MFTVRVVDIKGDPIPFASVYAIGTTYGTMTDDDGWAKLASYMNGGIRVSCVGFKTFETDPSTGSTIELEKAVYGLPAVLIKAKKIVAAGAKKNYGWIFLLATLVLIISFNTSTSRNGR